MTESWAIVIAAAIPATMSFIGVVVARRGRDAANRAEAATKETHAANNEDHALTVSALIDLKASVNEVKRDVGGIRADHRLAVKRLDDLANRFTDHVSEKEDSK